jgi:hypothetical protein
MVVGVDAGRMAVGERDLDGVVPYLGCGGGSCFWLEHRKNRGRGKGRRSFGERFFLGAFVVAGGAGAVVAEIGKVEMRDMAVGPGDVYAGVCGDVDFDARGFTAGMERNGHGKSRQFSVRQEQ